MGVLEIVAAYLKQAARRDRPPEAAGRFRWRKVARRSHVRILTPSNARHRPLVISPAKDLAADFFAAPPTPTYQRQRPRLYECPVSIEAKITKASDLGPVEAPSGGAALLTDVSLLAGGVVATADGSIVEESLINTEKSKRFGPFFRPDGASELRIDMRFGAKHRRLSSDIHVLLKQTYDANYGHWLVECLPRLAFVSQHFDLSACKVIVSDWSHLKRIYIDTLAPFGIAPDQIVEVGYESVHVERLVYPLPITCHRFPYTKSPRVVDVLETIPPLIGTPGDTPRRLYVSRNRYHKRRLVNEAAVIGICEDLGLHVIYPETMTFADQMRAFSQAEIVVGNCGAGLTNIVFSPRGSVLFALASEFMHDGFFWDLTSLKDITYASLHGRAVTDPSDLTKDERLDLDFEIDVDKFANLLAGLLKEVAARQHSIGAEANRLTTEQVTAQDNLAAAVKSRVWSHSGIDGK